ncbi:Molybdenum cofactor biosynthesis protein MoaC [invertebrate metagenome]|uniref:cyclic pyranopterin monophosphate synthase n=1 Tax=invertebrate metagenome TaxID=1711999 RepID=A0A484HA77_9ZZZZ
MENLEERNVLTHIDASGKASMVDITEKAVTERIATASGMILMQPVTLHRIMNNTIEKGDVLSIARIAGIMAAKRTADLVPLCHPLALTAVSIDLTCEPSRNAVEIIATIRSTGQTGTEMEALTAVSVAALAVYDMCKAIDRSMRFTDIRLLHKSGGKSGIYERSNAGVK